MSNPTAMPHVLGGEAEKLLNVGEVADWLGVSPAWVRDHATRKQPRLAAVKLGKLLRFRRADVEEFIAECQRWQDKPRAAA